MFSVLVDRKFKTHPVLIPTGSPLNNASNKTVKRVHIAKDANHSPVQAVDDGDDDEVRERAQYSVENHVPLAGLAKLC
jgi:hypothetical protein